MLGPDHRLGGTFPVEAEADDPGVLRHRLNLATWRARSEIEQRSALAPVDNPGGGDVASSRRPRAPRPFLDRVRNEAEFCPFGSGPCGCGDGPPRLCSDPDRPDLVRRWECLDCRALVLWEAEIA